MSRANYRLFDLVKQSVCRCAWEYWDIVAVRWRALRSSSLIHLLRSGHCECPTKMQTSHDGGRKVNAEVKRVRVSIHLLTVHGWEVSGSNHIAPSGRFDRTTALSVAHKRTMSAHTVPVEKCGGGGPRCLNGILYSRLKNTLVEEEKKRKYILTLIVNTKTLTYADKRAERSTKHFSFSLYLTIAFEKRITIG